MTESRPTRPIAGDLPSTSSRPAKRAVMLEPGTFIVTVHPDGKGYEFHRLPDDPDRREKWLEAYARGRRRWTDGAEVKYV